MTDPVITDVRIHDERGRRVVHATFDDGHSDELFAFFADEILFCEGDLVGKTETQARELYFRRDRDYLQS